MHLMVDRCKTYAITLVLYRIYCRLHGIDKLLGGNTKLAVQNSHSNMSRTLRYYYTIFFNFCRPQRLNSSNSIKGVDNLYVLNLIKAIGSVLEAVKVPLAEYLGVLSFLTENPYRVKESRCKPRYALYRYKFTCVAIRSVTSRLTGQEIPSIALFLGDNPYIIATSEPLTFWKPCVATAITHSEYAKTNGMGSFFWSKTSVCRPLNQVLPVGGVGKSLIENEVHR